MARSDEVPLAGEHSIADMSTNNSTDNCIISSRLRLRPATEDDTDLIVTWRNKPEVMRFFFYRTQNAVIWGLTAELLYHALHRLNQ